MDEHLEELQKLAKATFSQTTGLGLSNQVWFESQSSMSEGQSWKQMEFNKFENFMEMTANSIQQLIFNKLPFAVFWYSVTWKGYQNSISNYIMWAARFSSYIPTKGTHSNRQDTGIQGWEFS